jgi:hypothetical protein
VLDRGKFFPRRVDDITTLEIGCLQEQIQNTPNARMRFILYIHPHDGDRRPVESCRSRCMSPRRLRAPSTHLGGLGCFAISVISAPMKLFIQRNTKQKAHIAPFTAGPGTWYSVDDRNAHEERRADLISANRMARLHAHGVPARPDPGA